MRSPSLPPRLARWCAALIACLACLNTQAPAQQTQTAGTPAAAVAGAGAQPQDEDFARAVREWTTKPEFISPLVDHLPASGRIPSPKAVLGYHIGTPKKLTYYDDILKYYRALAAATPRVKVTPIGRTDEGREAVVVTIASEDTMRNIEQHRAWLAQIADPRTLTEPQAREVIGRAKPIYHLMGGLHSGETGPSEMLMELAYRLAVEDAPIINQIRNNIIVTITPVADPDGRDRYVDWYYRHLVDITDERDRTPEPPYWGKYVFHDNNRDINYSQMTMRTLLDWYLQWHPPIMHELHESVPFLYTFSGQAPQNPTLDPILFGELPWFANFEMAQMTKYGMPGVWTHGFVDMWSPGYLGFMSSNHNGMLRMYETFGNGGATTMRRRIGSSPDNPSPGPSPTTREWYRPLPPYNEVEWSMRNNTNYMQTGVLSGMQLAAAFPQVVLENFYRKSRNSIEAGRTEPPHAFIIPAGQADMTRVMWMLNLLRVQGIEIGRATGEIKLKDATYPAGSFIVKRDQPYGRLAKILLEKQNFPDASLRTYDDSGWTMGLMTQTEVREISDRAVLDVPVEPVAELKLPGTVSGGEARWAYAVAHNGSANMITLRVALKGLTVRAAEAPFRAGGVDFRAGSFVVPVEQGGGDVHNILRTNVERLGLTAAALDVDPEVATHELDLPRIAMFSTWGNTQEVGWLRHAFDQYVVPYDLIYKERVRKGNLRADYDVIVVPHQGRTGKGVVYDIESTGKPIAYTKTERFKFLGAYGESEDITGGMGLEGVIEFQKFLDTGGVLMTLGAASFFPADFGLVRFINAGRASSQFYAPGPIVEAEIVQRSHPIFYGYPAAKVPVRWASGPLLQIPEEDRPWQVLMRFSGGDQGVLSGLMKGAGEITNRPAIVDVPAGKGHVIMYATNPSYRWQNLGEFNMLFNALMNYNDFRPSPSAPKPTAPAP